MLSLRTNKSDSLVGLADGLAEQTALKAPNFRVSGSYAVLSGWLKDDEAATALI